ncbi:MAG: hypothetical protein IRZ13_19985 [Acetobacteraceae bacterium]|nr:hypothetical protein [Acetobacteraceae bacterium]
MRLAGAPRPPRSCLDLARSPTAAAEMEALRRRAWHEHGVASLPIEDIADPWLRQAVINEAARRWGPRTTGGHNGR